MPGTSKSGEAISALEAELYFLIARYLSSGPCKKATEVLKQELEEHKLLPKKVDWTGEEHLRSYENLVELNQHLSADHLLRICQRVGPLLDKDVKPIVRGVMSLVGAGRQSLLRTPADVKHVRWAGRTFVATHHGKSLLPPRNLAYHPNIAFLHLSQQQLSSGIRKGFVVGGKMYSRMSLMTRSLGHLSAVYCVAFDQTGKYIFTGADDHLVKIWSAVSGRLLATLRGHAAEITDLAVSYENTLLAAGSCDKMIRVWSLKTTIPVAVLHGHTGMITSLQFCPISRGDSRYLVSTGGDGCVCFWQWNINTNKFNPKPMKFIERSRAGAQMLCSSFSPGGVFLATGSSDQVIRVYCFSASSPEKICELEAHTDRVDSIQYGNCTNRFISGSRDGTARIWHYERQEWKGIPLNIGQRLPVPSTGIAEADDSSAKVTMVGWAMDDIYVVTAVSDFSLKVWDSYTGQLVYVLQGHKDEVFVLENNPVATHIMLSAGHDGHIIIWDMSMGTMIKSFFNTIEGQGHGAVFDCKWSPDGQSFAATDSHGFSMLYGFGTNEKYRRLPEEQFFHTDYRPLIRDANNYVLDEQTQQPPHLMPPPFLVDVDGNPHPPALQRLVPGREGANSGQLVPQIGISPSGDREILDDVLEAASGSREHTVEERAAAAVAAAVASGSGQRPSIEDMIQRLQREQDQRIAAEGGEPLRSPRRESRDGPLSPSHSRGLRRSGEMEGVRQSSGNVPVSRRATATDIDAWRRRVVVPELDPALAKSREEWRHHMAEDEIKKFVSEKKRKPLPGSENDSSDSGSYMKTRRRKQQSSRSRRSQPETTGRNRLTARALYDTEEEEEEESGADTAHETDHIWDTDSSSDGESSEYSDWVADAGVNLQPPKRSQRQPKKRRFSSTDEDEDYEEEGEKTPTPKKKKPPSKKKRERREQQKRRVLDQQDDIQELPEEFRPPEWLTDTIPRKAPYVPQIGDEVIYFRQGHEGYVQAVKRNKIYDINPTKNQPWHKMPNLREQELVKIVGIKYEIRPPRMVCLKLGFIDHESSKLTGGTFTIKYHDMPDVIDFLVLRQTYDTAMSRNWCVGDRFRSMIDDAWWMGSIESQEPFQPEFPDCMFQCFNVHWDNGEIEKMSPWDLEPIDENRVPSAVGGSVPVTQDELKSLMYTPRTTEWPPHGRDMECERIIQGMEVIMELRISEFFLAPVDLNTFPVYAMVIEYPVDLSTIRARLENHFYRRVNSIQYDVRYIESNAAKFNEPNSQIVQCAKLVTELCLRFIGDPNCTDPRPIYNELTRDVDFAIGPPSADEADGAGPSSGLRSQRGDAAHIARKRKSDATLDSNAWKEECRQLVETMIECEDSQPFRTPVDPSQYPDYRELVTIPMDLSTAQTKLQTDQYDTPVEFSKDIRLMFSNSRTYNTNKRSRIYAMTLRLSAMFEDHIREIISDWKMAVKFEKTGKMPPKKKTTEHIPPTQPSTSRSTPGSSRVAMTTRESSSTSYSPIPREPLSTPRATRSHGAVSTSTSAVKRESRPLRQTPKRKRRETGSDSDEDVGHTDHSSEDVSSDDSGSDFELGKKKKPPMKKKPPPKKKSKPSLVNGHSQKYGTRHSQRAIKRKKYTEKSSEDESENSDSGSDTSKSESDSDSSSSSSSSSSSGSESESESGSGSASESGSDTGSEGVRRSRRTATRQNTKATRSCESQRRTSQRSPKQQTFHKNFFHESAGRGAGSSSGSSNSRVKYPKTRNQGKRTVRYQEESDFEYGGASGSDDDSEERPTVSMSSRGRIRRLTPRARALIGD